MLYFRRLISKFKIRAQAWHARSTACKDTCSSGLPFTQRTKSFKWRSSSAWCFRMERHDGLRKTASKSHGRQSAWTHVTLHPKHYVLIIHSYFGSGGKASLKLRNNLEIPGLRAKRTGVSKCGQWSGQRNLEGTVFILSESINKKTIVNAHNSSIEMGSSVWIQIRNWWCIFFITATVGRRDICHKHQVVGESNEQFIGRHFEAT